MITQIGIVSGKILSLFEESRGPFEIDEIDLYVDEPYELTMMALGWLVREGMVHTQGKDGKIFIATEANSRRPSKENMVSLNTVGYCGKG